MGLETANYINQLNADNPRPSDPKSQGDDHIRLIKKCLQNSIGGAGIIYAYGTEKAGASSNLHDVTIPNAPASYAELLGVITFVATHNNTSSVPQMRINNLPYVPLRDAAGNDMPANSIRDGAVTQVVYANGQFRVVSSLNITSQLSGYAPINNPTFTGVPRGPTATAGTSSTQLATTQFVMENSGGGPGPGQTDNLPLFLLGII